MCQRVADSCVVFRSIGYIPVTTSVYDMGDRRTEVNHPASGITSFTYDPLGNVLTKQTANMAEEGKMITYTYDYHRLTGISYPDHPENNVKYYYGGRNASHNRIGRLMMREDGTGAIEYFYGKMGEVTKTRRTLVVPNQAIATYVTQWTYDSHNRLIEMIYPDEEKVTYSYNLGGLLEKVRGEKSYGYDYITKLGYDKFEQRSYLKYCNGAETFYTYDDRRRLSNLAVSSGGTTIMDNAYTFDAVSNVLSVANNASLPANGNAGGQMSHTYTYDGLYRLATATGTYTGADNKSASYTLAMGYDNMHRITSKSQHLTQDNVQSPSRSKTPTTTRTCSSTTIRTISEAPASSPTLTARSCSTSNMCRSARSSSRSATTYGTLLIFSMRKSSTRKLECTITVLATTIHVSAFGCQLTQCKKSSMVLRAHLGKQSKSGRRR